MKAIITICVLTTLCLTIIAQNVADDISNLLSVRVEGGGYGFRDETFIHFAEGATTAYDEEIDAKKWWSLDPEATMIWTVTSNGINVAINNLPLADLHTITNSIPLHFVCGYNGGAYALEFSDLESFDAGIDIWLEDTQTEDGWFQISEADSMYVFTGIPDAPADRFMIHIFDPLAVGVNEKPARKEFLTIFSSINTVYIKNPKNEYVKQISVFDIGGKEVYRTTGSAQEKLKFNVDLIPGIYIVHVITSEIRHTGKIYITNF